MQLPALAFNHARPNDTQTATHLLACASTLSQWPALSGLGLTATERAVRRHSIGGSDANIILSDDSERLLRLWREKRGEAETEDLSGVLPVMMGSWTEAFNRSNGL